MNQRPDKSENRGFAFDGSSESFRLLAPSWKAKDFAKILVGAFVFWVCALAFVPWQQTSFGIGRVVAYSPTDRQQTVDAPVDGRLGRWFVFEGSHVEPGDPIVEMSDNDPEIINRLKAERQAFASRLEAARLSTSTAKINLERQQRLERQGLSSRRAFELSKLEYARYLTDEESAKADLIRIETRLARQTTQMVKAPRSGFILRRTAGESSVLVKSGETLALLVPDTESRAVELWIGGNDISLMRVGQKVRIQFEGWPAIQFSGWPILSMGTFSGEIAVIDAADNGEGKFRILVIPDEKEPWPSGTYLRQGVRAQGWVLLGTVKLGYELWRKLNGFPPSWVGSNDKFQKLRK